MSDLNKKGSGLAGYFGKAADFHDKKEEHHQGLSDDHKDMMEAHKAAADAFADHGKDGEAGDVHKAMCKTMGAYHKAAMAFHKSKMAKHAKMAKAHGAHAEHLRKMAEHFSTATAGEEKPGQMKEKADTPTEVVKAEEPKAEVKPEAPRQEVKVEEPKVQAAAAGAEVKTEVKTEAPVTNTEEPKKEGLAAKVEPFDFSKAIGDAFASLDLPKLISEQVTKAVDEKLSKTMEPVVTGLMAVPRTSAQAALMAKADRKIADSSNGDYPTGL